MKIIADLIKIWARKTTMCFTLVMLGMSLAGYMVRPDSNALLCSQIFYIFAFGALYGVSCIIAGAIKVNSVIKAAIHFVLTYVSFVLTFYLGGAGKSFLDNASSNKVLSIAVTTLLFIGIYVVSAAVVFACNFIKHKLTAKDEVYESQFDGVSTTNQD